MEFDLEHCWDCPVWLTEVIPYLILCAAVAGAGLWVALRRKGWRSLVGVIVAVPAMLFQLGSIVYVPHWGLRLTELTTWFDWDARLLLLLIGVLLPAAVWHATWGTARHAT